MLERIQSPSFAGGGPFGGGVGPASVLTPGQCSPPGGGGLLVNCSAGPSDTLGTSLVGIGGCSATLGDAFVGDGSNFWTTLAYVGTIRTGAALTTLSGSPEDASFAPGGGDFIGGSPEDDAFDPDGKHFIGGPPVLLKVAASSSVPLSAASNKRTPRTAALLAASNSRFCSSQCFPMNASIKEL